MDDDELVLDDEDDDVPADDEDEDSLFFELPAPPEPPESPEFPEDPDEPFEEDDGVEELDAERLSVR